MPICDSGESQAASLGDLITSAPKANKTFTFSSDIFSGKVTIHLYPHNLAAKANPIPVFPDVASINVAPGFKYPSASAYLIIRTPILSFKDPAAFKNSHLAKNSHFKPSDYGILFNLIIGVFPIASKALERIFFLS